VSNTSPDLVNVIVNIDEIELRRNALRVCRALQIPRYHQLDQAKRCRFLMWGTILASLPVFDMFCGLVIFASAHPPIMQRPS
jgi:hypothetical protein